MEIQEYNNDKEAETEIIAIKKEINSLKETNIDVLKQVKKGREENNKLKIKN